MPNPVAHFAIHADDVERARRFYSSVFQWTFSPWGPPGFYMITTEEQGIHGSLQERTEPLSGTGLSGFECTISVSDLEATSAEVETHGGTLLAAETVIPGVGKLRPFLDTEGNKVVVMEYVRHE